VCVCSLWLVLWLPSWRVEAQSRVRKRYAKHQKHHVRDTMPTDPPGSTTPARERAEERDSALFVLGYRKYYTTPLPLLRHRCGKRVVESVLDHRLHTQTQTHLSGPHQPACTKHTCQAHLCATPNDVCVASPFFSSIKESSPFDLCSRHCHCSQGAVRGGGRGQGASSVECVFLV
jgi:hypothetical protein